MTKNIKWRLAKLPTPDELVSLVNAKLLTQEEAKEILLSHTDERDTDSLKEEIKFLRDIVEKLSKPDTIIQTIKSLPGYITTPWYSQYDNWCQITPCAGGSSTMYLNGSTTNANSLTLTNTSAFSGIETF
jgi:sulfatase maturation enzyme AslB (radical SAM superfamily)